MLLTAVQAQRESVFISGHIRDALTGEALQGCHVEVRQDRGGIVRRIPVNGSGVFLRDVSSMSEGSPRYTVYFELEGYVPLAWRIDVSGLGSPSSSSSGWSISYDVQLAPGKGGFRKSKCVFKDHEIGFKCTGRPADAFRSTYSLSVVETVHKDWLAAFDTLPSLYIYGYVLDYWTREKIAGAEVSINVEGEDAERAMLRTDVFGFYSYNLAFDKTYRITYVSDSMVRKTLTLDLHDVPQENRQPGYSAYVAVRLFAPIPDEDLSFLEQPVGRLSYNKDNQTVEWDLQYTAPLMERLDAILARSRGR